MTKYTIRRTNTLHSAFNDSSNTHTHALYLQTFSSHLLLQPLLSQSNFKTLTSKCVSLCVCVCSLPRWGTVPFVCRDKTDKLLSRRQWLSRAPLCTPRGCFLGIGISLAASSLLLCLWLLQFFSLTNTHISIHSERRVKWAQSRKLLVNSFSPLMLLN